MNKFKSKLLTEMKQFFNDYENKSNGSCSCNPAGNHRRNCRNAVCYNCKGDGHWARDCNAPFEWSSESL